jgi:phage regulator Rha-like protein
MTTDCKNDKKPPEGKQHNDVLKAIRKMEPAWAKVTQGNFSLSTYQDATGRTLPCYVLTKTARAEISALVQNLPIAER